jgi:hypothetical protein
MLLSSIKDSNQIVNGLLADWLIVHELACVRVCVFVVIVAVAASMTTSVLLRERD